MSKKERRRREREKGDANFKSGAYKTKKKTMKEKAMGVNFDKLDDKVSAIIIICGVPFLLIGVNL